MNILLILLTSQKKRDNKTLCPYVPPMETQTIPMKYSGAAGGETLENKFLQIYQFTGNSGD